MAGNQDRDEPGTNRGPAMRIRGHKDEAAEPCKEYRMALNEAAAALVGKAKLGGTSG
ncbi:MULTISPECIES: hypothetical protein [unclassified Lysobacter]|jgi:hypothetical protein|uniref:hypothetical protein n=1 Tax=unclassified Lysobacter TaxID=2635362 RepID=UPI001F573F0E|nr:MULTISPECIES: hypothetical protein [unclassified Lysobacter]